MFEMAMTAPDRTPDPAPVCPPGSDDAALLLGKLQAFCGRVLGVAPGHPDAEDCAQEALARGLAHESERGPGFVFGIARNVALDHLRKRGRRRETPIGAADSQSELGRAPSDELSPEERSAAAERDARLAEALDQLPENQRVALRMFYLERMPYESIAKTMGVSMGTVATWLSRGKARLALQLRRSAP